MTQVLLGTLIGTVSVSFLASGGPLGAETGAISAVNQIILVDDFDRGAPVNKLGGDSQGDEEYPGGCVPVFVKEPSLAFGGSGQSLRLDYDVTEANSFSYFWMKTGPGGDLQGTSRPVDLTGYRYVSMWIKSDEKMPRFGIEIHQDQDGDGYFVQGKDRVAKVLVTRYLESETSEVWRKVVIPLADFRFINNWGKILEIAFIFENKSRSKKGWVALDDLLFGSWDPGVVDPLSRLEKEKVLGSFKINGVEADGGRISAGETNKIELTLRSVPPELERVRLDLSSDGGASWKSLVSFYEHSPGGRYEYNWTPSAEEVAKGILIRVVASDILGRGTILWGPVK